MKGMSCLSNRSSWAPISLAALSILCATCLIGVTAYADDPDPAPAVVSDDSGSDPDLPLDSGDPATDTDLPEELKEHLDEADTMDSKIILLERGTVIVANNNSDPEVLRSPAATSSEVGYVIHVTSTIGSDLLVPSDYALGSFCLDANGNLIGCRSGTFTCYMGQYSVRFPVYGQPEYRVTNGTGYTWQSVDLQYDSSSSVEVLGAHIPWWSDKYKVLISVATMFFVLILALRRRK